MSNHNLKPEYYLIIDFFLIFATLLRLFREQQTRNLALIFKGNTTRVYKEIIKRSIYLIIDQSLTF